MQKNSLEIIPYTPIYLKQIIELSIRSWAPVFPLMEQEIPEYVFKAFYPEGWETRQRSDIKATLQDGETKAWIALIDKKLSGYIGIRMYKEDSMGEVYIIAVDPEYQRQGVSTALLEFGFDWMKQKGLAMAMVETGADKGHAPSRATYESVGFERYPVARYFRKL